MSKAARTMAVFINKGTPTVPDWLRFKKSTALTIEYNPETEPFDYISDDVATDEVMRYKPAFDQDFTIEKGYDDYEYFNDLRHELPVGEAAHRQILTVDYNNGDNTDGYYAEVQDSVVSITDYNTTDGKLNAHIAFCGNRKIGTCKIVSGVPTFTENE